MDTNDILKVVILGLLLFLTIEISYFYTEATFIQEVNNNNNGIGITGLISEVFNGIGYILEDVKTGIDNFFEELSIQSSNR